MRRFSLGKQIAFIFILAFVLTTLIVGLLVTRSLNNAYRARLYESLEAEGKAIRVAQDIEAYQPAEHMAYIVYASDEDAHTASDNIGEYVDGASIPLMAAKADTQEGNTGHYANTIGGKTIFYVILRYKGFFDVQKVPLVIIVTDTFLINEMARDTSVRVLIACLIAFAVGYLVVFLWSRGLLKSIRGIRDDISRMGRDHYRTKITSARRDELGDLVGNIEDMRHQIILREQSRQELLQGISHDLKTPVGIIRSYAEALEDGMCDPGTAANVTRKQADRLAAKVNKLLNLTRLGYIDTGHMPKEKVPVDELIRDLAAGYAYQSDILFEQDLDAVFFDGDAESWRIAIENILDNAIRYAKTKIVLTLKEDTLSIFNDGKQIEEAYLSRIFRPYEKSRDGRFGLGLAIVHRTVALFGYKIRVENVEDGVKFTIYR